jgi:hypothetical protein
MMVGMGAAMGRVRLGWGLWRGIIGLLLTELGSLFKGLMSWLGWVGQGGLVGCIYGSPPLVVLYSSGFVCWLVCFA